MALRARAATVSNHQSINDQPAAGKQFFHPPATKRNVLQDKENLLQARQINSKARSASVNEDALREASRRDLKINLRKNKVEEKTEDEVEQMEVVEPEIEDIDKDDVGNPQLVVEYVHDIYNYLRHLERVQCVHADYLAGQSVILPKMRAVLVDWMIGVHSQFRLLAETMYTAVAILDRFVQKEVNSVTRTNLQLVGVAAMLVASKYEEIYAPEVKDFVYITDKAYTEKEILRMELRILHVLEFDLGRPLPLHFLRRASKAGGVEATTHTLAKYTMELSLSDYQLISEPPSRLAAASLALSVRLLEPGIKSMTEVWTRGLVHYTKYELSELLKTMERLATLLIAAPTAKLNGAYIKYSNRKFNKISRIPALADPVLKEIAAGKIQ